MLTRRLYWMIFLSDPPSPRSALNSSRAASPRCYEEGETNQKQSLCDSWSLRTVPKDHTVVQHVATRCGKQVGTRCGKQVGTRCGKQVGTRCGKQVGTRCIASASQKRANHWDRRFWFSKSFLSYWTTQVKLSTHDSWSLRTISNDQNATPCNGN